MIALAWGNGPFACTVQTDHEKLFKLIWILNLIVNHSNLQRRLQHLISWGMRVSSRLAGNANSKNCQINSTLLRDCTCSKSWHWYWISEIQIEKKGNYLKEWITIEMAAVSISYPSAHSVIGLKPTAVLWDMYAYTVILLWEISWN